MTQHKAVYSNNKNITAMSHDIYLYTCVICWEFVLFVVFAQKYHGVIQTTSNPTIYVNENYGREIC